MFLRLLLMLLDGSAVKKIKSLALPSEARVFHFDLKVFAASLTVMRSGESVRTAGI